MLWIVCGMKSLILRTRLNVTPVEMLMRGEGGLAPGSHIYGNLNGTRTEGITLSLAGLRGAGLQASDAELSAECGQSSHGTQGCRLQGLILRTPCTKGTWSHF